MSPPLMADTVVEQVAERLDIPTSEARLVLNALSKLIHQQAEQEGRVRVPGIGIFERVEGNKALQFTPDAALERVVNHRYAGMAPAVAAPPVADALASEPESFTLAPPAAATGAPDQEEAGTTSSGDTPAADVPTVTGKETGDQAETHSAPEPSSKTPEDDGTEEAADEPPSPSLVPEDEAPDSQEAEDAGAVPTVEAAGDEVPTAPDESGDSDGPEPSSEPASEQATPNRAPALIGLVLALLLAAGAAWWLLSDEPTTPPETPDMAVIEPEPADETDQTPPDAVTDPETADDAADGAADGTLDEAAPPAEADALADGVGTDDLPADAGTIDPTLGGFALVVASVPSQEDAEAIETNYRNVIADDPLPTGLLVSQTGDATRYRVGVGQFATQEEALAVRDARSDVFPGDAWVLRLTPNMARN